MIPLDELVNDIANELVRVDASGQAFRGFHAGVGPYGEPQLVKLIADGLNSIPRFRNAVRTKRTPDLLIQDEWALEFKIVRPFGDNAKEAENWSVNLIHPYAGNVSTIGDCYKLAKWPGAEQKAAIVIGYEHTPPKLPLDPLLDSFELITKHVARISLSKRVESRRVGLVHPVHQCARVIAWEVLGLM
jgi:hypothetical protein